jgi:hypothetical protein
VTVAAVGLPGLPAWALGFGGRLALGERRSLALAGPPRVFEELLQLKDGCVPGREGLGQLADTSLKMGNGRLQVGEETLVITRRTGACRNSPRYARGAVKWWTPLSKYVAPSG